ncbi:hypothetical protein BGZ67_009154, partial [Mortierella alpina]
NNHGHQLTIKHTHDIIRGFSATLDQITLNVLLEDPEVDYIEPEAIFTSHGIEGNAPWNLARISTRYRGSVRDYLDDSHVHDTTVYILDTGINMYHQEFAGRVAGGQSFVTNEPDYCDRNGHGTHVAGIIAGRSFGVHKTAKIVAVKVLDSQGRGSTSGIIEAIRWSTEHLRDKRFGLMILPLGGGRSPALNEAAYNAYRAGMPVIAAAGDERQDACNVSPASATGTLTVTASDKSNIFAPFSNYGQCTHAIAPGIDIPSAWKGTCASSYSHNQVNTLSGTSMAAAHVAGVAALLRSRGMGTSSPDDLYRVVIQHALPNVVKNVPYGTPNRLIRNAAT